MLMSCQCRLSGVCMVQNDCDNTSFNIVFAWTQWHFHTSSGVCMVLGYTDITKPVTLSVLFVLFDNVGMMF